MSNIRNRPPRVKGPIVGNGRHSKPGRASQYIQQASQVLRPDMEIVICIRVSKHTQTKNMNDQEAVLLMEADKLGAIVVGKIRYVRHGSDPSWLLDAAKFGDDVKLLAESTDRFIRNPDFQTDKQGNNLTARVADFEYLQKCTKGKQLLTIIHPDASPADIRSYQRKRGQKFKSKGGPPERKKHRKERLFNKVISLHRKGKSLTCITVKTQVPRSTAHRWICLHFGCPILNSNSP